MGPCIKLIVEGIVDDRLNTDGDQSNANDARNGIVVQLFVSDLDFTLLGDGGVLSSDAAVRLNDLIAKGLIFTVATARSAPSIQHLFSAVNLELPVIEANGAILRDLQSGQIIRHRGLGMESAAIISDAFRELDIAPYVSGLIGGSNPLFCPEQRNMGMKWFFDEKVGYGDPRLVESVTDPIRDGQNLEDVLGFIYLGSKSEIDRIAALVTEQAPRALVTSYPNHYTGEWEIIISAMEANKGYAIDCLIHYMRDDRGIDVSETTAFGDSSNDLTMLTAVNNAIAVANASDDIKSCAGEIIGHHNENSVLLYLEQLFKPTID